MDYPVHTPPEWSEGHRATDGRNQKGIEEKPDSPIPDSPLEPRSPDSFFSLDFQLEDIKPDILTEAYLDTTKDVVDAGSATSVIDSPRFHAPVQPMTSSGMPPAPSADAVPRVPFEIGCTNCRKTEEDFGRPLLFCEKCIEGNPYMRYCSEECQKVDWPLHKKICGVAINPRTGRPIQQMPARTTQYHLVKTDGSNVYDIFRNIPTGEEIEAYRLVVESYRLLDELKRDIDPASWFGQTFYRWLNGYKYGGLQKYLQKTLDQGVWESVMPEWWDQEHRDKCARLAREEFHWDDLPTIVPPEINTQWRYGSIRMRLCLRIVACKIDGSLTDEETQRAEGMNALDIMGHLKIINVGY